MRARRRLHGLAGLACLGAAVAVIVMLAIGYLGGAQVQRGGIGVAVNRARMMVVHSTMSMQMGPQPGRITISGGGMMTVLEPAELYIPGLTYQRMLSPPAVLGGPPLRTTIVRVPLWLPLAVFAVLGAVFAWRWWIVRAVGGCPRCGYDTRGIVGPCPECGRASAQPTVVCAP